MVGSGCLSTLLAAIFYVSYLLRTTEPIRFPAAYRAQNSEKTGRTLKRMSCGAVRTKMPGSSPLMEEGLLMQPLLQSHVPGIPCRRGKVRDVYDLGDRLVIVATDRISAFDWVLPTGIPDKGRVLTGLTLFWLDYLGVPNHLISTDVQALGPAFAAQAAELEGRTCLVRKAKVVPIECVVRGYLAGSGWSEYRKSGTVCGIPLPSGLRQCERLPEPIFTPATKEESGHDQNISFEQMIAITGRDVATELRQKSLDVYRRGADYALKHGIIVADTKFEWGHTPDGQLILIDEVLTPDS